MPTVFVKVDIFYEQLIVNVLYSNLDFVVQTKTITHCFSCLWLDGTECALIATLERRAGRKSIGASVFFERKIVDFSFKKHTRPKELRSKGVRKRFFGEKLLFFAKYMTKKQIPFRTRFARAKREGKWFIFRALPEK